MIGMTVTQTGHQISTSTMNRSLISSGAHKALPKFISNDFVMKARLDGKVEEIDTEHNVIILRYKDGSKGIIDLEEKHRRTPDGKHNAVIKTL